MLNTHWMYEYGADVVVVDDVDHNNNNNMNGNNGENKIKQNE